ILIYVGNDRHHRRVVYPKPNLDRRQHCLISIACATGEDLATRTEKGGKHRESLLRVFTSEGQEKEKKETIRFVSINLTVTAPCPSTILVVCFGVSVCYLPDLHPCGLKSGLLTGDSVPLHGN